MITVTETENIEWAPLPNIASVVTDKIDEELNTGVTIIQSYTYKGFDNSSEHSYIKKYDQSSQTRKYCVEVIQKPAYYKGDTIKQIRFCTIFEAYKIHGDRMREVFEHYVGAR